MAVCYSIQLLCYFCLLFLIMHICMQLDMSALLGIDLTSHVLRTRLISTDRCGPQIAILFEEPDLFWLTAADL